MEIRNNQTWDLDKSRNLQDNEINLEVNSKGCADAPLVSSTPAGKKGKISCILIHTNIDFMGILACCFCRWCLVGPYLKRNTPLLKPAAQVWTMITVSLWTMGLL